MGSAVSKILRYRQTDIVLLCIIDYRRPKHKTCRVAAHRLGIVFSCECNDIWKFDISRSYSIFHLSHREKREWIMDNIQISSSPFFFWYLGRFFKHISFQFLTFFLLYFSQQNMGKLGKNTKINILLSKIIVIYLKLKYFYGIEKKPFGSRLNTRC